MITKIGTSRFTFSAPSLSASISGKIRLGSEFGLVKRKTAMTQVGLGFRLHHRKSRARVARCVGTGTPADRTCWTATSLAGF